MTAPWLTIVGIGEDGPDGLSEAARDRVRDAELVVGGRRHLILADRLIRREHLVWPRPLSDAYPAILARQGAPVAVLASGDPFCHGVGVQLSALVPPEQMQCFPHLSAFALARARLAWAAEDTSTMSFCGRPLALLAPLLQPGGRVLALSANAGTPAGIATLLRDRGFGPSVLHVLEAMGGPQERIRTTTAAAYDLRDVHPLNVVALDLRAAPDARIMPLASGLPDALFDHDGQFSRREMRAVTLSSLAPRRGDLLWDVGAGSGAIGIEWMLRHPANRAIAIESDPARAARIARNADSLGVPTLRLVTGQAPDALAGLPPPDAVFLGGGAHRQGVIESAWDALKPDGRLVANAVTIETEAALLAARARLGGTLLRLSVERLDAVGSMHAYRPAMTVTQWLAVKP
jgi:precorrin-6Y C5,15-methyltransferase (decarboxylating)